MSTIHLFDKKREFVEWVKGVSSQISGSEMWAAFGYDPISWSLKAATTHSSEKPDWANVVLRLPISARQAGQVWGSIQEENLCLFYLLEVELGSILVAARNGAWCSLDDRFLSYRKGAFSELCYDDACKLVDDNKIWSALCREVRMFGVGCRVLQRQPT